MFDTSSTSSPSDRNALAQDTVCEICGYLTCEAPNDCATVLRVLADDAELHAEASRLPPAPDEDLTCMACGAEPTHSDGEWGYCEQHAPEGAEGAVF